MRRAYHALYRMSNKNTGFCGLQNAQWYERLKPLVHIQDVIRQQQDGIGTMAL
jgi:hypothetical protein